MSREAHVRFWESAGVRFPRATRLPLYRLEQIAARDRVMLSRSTLAAWVGRIGVALQPLADRLAVLLRSCSVLHADETPVRQLDPGAGKTKRAYLWAYRTNGLQTGPPIVVFDYQASRAGQHAREFLRGWQGHLMVDDYGGYKALFATGIIELGCLAHARRKFFELNSAQPNAIALVRLFAEVAARRRWCASHPDRTWRLCGGPLDARRWCIVTASRFLAMKTSAAIVQRPEIGN